MSRYQDPADADKSVVFDVTFGPARLHPAVMDDFRARGKIPFTVSVDFRREEMEGPAFGNRNRFDHPQVVPVLREVNVYSIMDGHAEIAVLDAEGNVVDRQRQALALLCPS